MMRFALQPAARRGGRVATTLRYGPAAAALAYPLLLMLLHRCGRQLAEATTATTILSAGVGVSGAAALIVGVPLLSFVAIRQSDDLQTRRLAHLAFAAPPLFTATGLVCLFLGMPGGDTVAWGILWTGALFCAARKSPATETTITRSADWIRTAHGLSAGVIIGGFVIWHLANHVVALWSLDHNKSIMDVLRPWYRSDLVQPLLLALLLWQLFSGLRLLWAKLPSASDLYSSIQTATAAYLAVYVPSHLIAVLVLGRWLLAVDTNFAWASGAPTGLLLDPWNVRLVPHYFLAVLFLIGHLAVGLRAILLSHGVRAITAARTTWAMCTAGLALSLAVTVAQLRIGTGSSVPRVQLFDRVPPSISRSSAHVANENKKATVMSQWFLCRRIGALERAWNYDASYNRAIIDVDPRPMIAFGRVPGLSRCCQDVPLAIGLIAVTAEDRGSSIQLGIDMAERSGGDSANLPAIAAGDS